MTSFLYSALVNTYYKDIQRVAATARIKGVGLPRAYLAGTTGYGLPPAPNIPWETESPQAMPPFLPFV
jgi:hypothetical protein